MKKKQKAGLARNVFSSWLKCVLIMKITAILLIVGLTSSYAKTTAQNTRLNFIVERGIVKDVIEKVEQQTDLSFMYDNRVFDVNREISIRVENKTVDELMDDLLAGKGLKYEMVNRYVVISPVKEMANGQQQPKKVSGKVSDSSGAPLPGVTVVVKGTATGIITDNNGNFSISNIPESAVLQFSFVGMKGQEIAVRGKTSINVTLAEEAIGIEEVVAVGYGTMKKVDITGSTSNIKANLISEIPGLRIDQMLQGKASGMMVTQVNGAPGSSSSIRIRGNNSITASSEPLYVIDGLLGAADLSTINPADIADISILKDASATAIYGSRGANGVILITTKKGTVGSSQINVNVQRGTQWLPREIDLLSGTEYAQLLNESRIAAGGTAVYDKPESVRTTNWQKETTKIAPMTNISVSTSGGSEKIKYFISGNYFNQDGIIKRTGVERQQFRANLESKFTEKIKIGVDINAGRISTDNNTVPMTPPNNVLTVAPSMSIYNIDGTYNYTYPHPQYNGRYNTPVACQNLITNQNFRANLVLNAYAEYSLLDWIKIKSTYGGSMISYGRGNNYTDSKLPGQTTNQQFGTASMSYNDGTNYQNENTISFTKKFAEKHFIDGVIGLTFQGGINQNANAGAQGFFSDELTWNNLATGDPITRSIGSSYENWSMVSYLARFTYKFKDRYLITATGREDGSSRLGAGNKWAFFPSVALGWVASEEPFIKDLGLFSFLKFRASYGSVGNQAVGIYQTMSVLTSINTVVNETKVSGWAPGQVSGSVSIVGNPNLKWEIKKQLDLGAEANFLNNRLSFSFDYYDAKTNNLLLLSEIPSQTGYTQQMSNVGEVSNKGFDITINSVNIEKPKFRWSTQLTLSHNQNEVLKLGPTGADIITHTYTYGVKPIGVLRIGEPVGSFLGYTSDGIWKETQGATSIMPGAKAGSIRYKDMNGDGKITQEDCVIMGNGSPSWYGGFGSSLSYKGLGFNIFFSGAWGAKIFNGNAPFLRSTDAQYNHYREVLNRWNPITNPDSDVPGALNLDRETYPSDRWVFNASYIRLESVSLSYHVPLSGQVKKYIKNVAVNLTGANLFCWSPYNKWGYDPVVNQKGGSDLGYSNSLMGFDYGAYPKAATFTIGVDFTF